MIIDRWVPLPIISNRRYYNFWVYKLFKGCVIELKLSIGSANCLIIQMSDYCTVHASVWLIVNCEIYQPVRFTKIIKCKISWLIIHLGISEHVSHNSKFNIFLVCRWTGRNAKEDVHQMDQCPVDQGLFEVIYIMQHRSWTERNAMQIVCGNIWCFVRVRQLYFVPWCTKQTSPRSCLVLPTDHWPNPSRHLPFPQPANFCGG